MSKNFMHIARLNKNDEFYTQYEDILNEVTHYKDKFINKIIYCNCDTEDSNFYKIFKNNFKNFCLKQLIITNIQTNIKTVYDGKNEKKIRLKNNGDFRSNECIETLLKSDIVVTNPPFSLFREFMNTLLEYSKDFIIIGNFTGVTYKNILPNFLNNKIYFGKSKRGMSFVIPDSNNLKSVNAVWFTTFYTERKLLTLTKVYNPNDFEKYDNTDIINIDNIKDIPINYYGLMGVPITFLEKYDANKFEVVNLARNLKINGVIKYYRIIIKRKV